MTSTPYPLSVPHNHQYTPPTAPRTGHLPYPLSVPYTVQHTRRMAPRSVPDSTAHTSPTRSVTDTA
eukprot:1426569-Rhodomonas_salina.1